MFGWGKSSDLRVSLSPSQVRSRLLDVAATPASWFPDFFGSKLFVGTVGERSFSLRVCSQTRGTMMPFLRGAISSEGGYTRIAATVGMHPGAIVICLILGPYLLYELCRSLLS